MKRILFSLALLLVLGGFLNVRAFAHDSKLHHIMMDIKEKAQELAHELEGDDPFAPRETVAALEALFLRAYAEHPSKTNTIAPGIERDLFLISYRQHMNKALGLVLQAEYLLREGKTENVREILRDLYKVSKEAHQKFQDKSISDR